MEILKEVTEWSCGYAVANHTYLFDGQRVIAYAEEGSNRIVQLTNGIKLSKRYRRFITVKHPGLERIAKNAPKREGLRSFNVESGKHTYVVEFIDDKFTCTCIGFMYHGKCKHIQAVRESINL